MPGSCYRIITTQPSPSGCPPVSGTASDLAAERAGREHHRFPQARVLVTPPGAEKEGRATSPDLTASSGCARAVASGSRGYALGYPRDQQWCRRPIREYVKWRARLDSNQRPRAGKLQPRFAASRDNATTISSVARTRSSRRRRCRRCPCIAPVAGRGTAAASSFSRHRAASVPTR